MPLFEKLFKNIGSENEGLNVNVLMFHPLRCRCTSDISTRSFVSAVAVFVQYHVNLNTKALLPYSFEKIRTAVWCSTSGPLHNPVRRNGCVSGGSVILICFGCASRQTRSEMPDGTEYSSNLTGISARYFLILGWSCAKPTCDIKAANFYSRAP